MQEKTYADKVKKDKADRDAYLRAGQEALKEVTKMQ